MLTDRIAKIKLLLLDVDGVLTDGRIVYSNSGDQLKFFDVTDGMGLALFSRAGLKSAILTAKESRIATDRVKDMHIDKVYQGALRKGEVFEAVLKDFDVSCDEVCFIGDDLVDIPVLKRVGLAVCVPNAVSEVKNHVHYTTVRKGGRGAVREVIDMILKSQGKWDKLMERYTLIRLRP
ncbi:MAG: HAD-IIIA family hydrolase [Candidatus Omnitrophica bacterium]|nr:HAD-IIIA family hydrolase [Candidatus Omnitrophota bacterium]